MRAWVLLPLALAACEAPQAPSRVQVATQCDKAGLTAPPVESTAPGVGGPNFASVFAQVSPSVVGVAAGRRNAEGRFVPTRSGTGFVWDDQGHVITNDHLIADASEVRVRTREGRVLRTKFVAGDGLTDVALLAIEGARRPPVAPRARSHALRPGEWVAAIGNPYGLEHSISVGVISAVGRRRLPGEKARFSAFVQTDINVNPGNSGGPLVDAAGEVVGINTAMVGNAQGLAFAIPIEQVAVIAGRLLRDGRFVRGFGGLVVRAVGDKAAARAGLQVRRGARVGRVVADGPAAKAGLVPNDIILRYGTVTLADDSALSWLIASTEPGQRVPLQVARGRERLHLEMVVEESR